MLSSHAHKLLSLTTALLAFTVSSALAADVNSTQATFLSPAGNFAFALTVPTDGDNADLYFTLAMSAALSWGAVGLGSNSMSHALVLMIYASGSGKNITFSPRIASGHSEPALYKELDYTVLPGTGIVNGTLVYSAVCHNCRSWPGGGALDFKGTAEQAIFAMGPAGAAPNDDRAAPLRYHAQYGSFTIDMRSAAGPAAAPVLSSASRNDGTALLGGGKSGQRDWAATMHAVIMVFCFVGLMPFGILILRLGEWVRWHGANQGLAAVGVIVGFGLGVRTSLLYVRSKKFDTAHQIIGIIVMAFVLVQFGLGFFHHRIYKKTKQPTKLAPIHVWLGRVVIVLGVFNGFLGFPLALASRYNYVLAGLVIAIVPIMFFILFWKRFFRRRRERQQAAPAQGSGYDPEPWSDASPPAYGGGYSGSQRGGDGAAGIALETLHGAHGVRKEEANVSTRDLGTHQTPRECV
ncbi:Integral membrane protein [Pleurostoma richardsiae]|uniref:Integral membrane protein n=1 Tax=Pleurostoma richardsiae TaxID=41990 RepID=A0AA38RVF9_9PEZI|nr:Integral membrane protein [Pleurostoma richardsiae]